MGAEQLLCMTANFLEFKFSRQNDKCISWYLYVFHSINTGGLLISKLRYLIDMATYCLQADPPLASRDLDLKGMG